MVGSPSRSVVPATNATDCRLYNRSREFLGKNNPLGLLAQQTTLNVSSVDCGVRSVRRFELRQLTAPFRRRSRSLAMRHEHSARSVTDRAPYALGGSRLLDMGDAEIGQRIDNRIDDDTRYGRNSAFAAEPGMLRRIVTISRYASISSSRLSCTASSLCSTQTAIPPASRPLHDRRLALPLLAKISPRVTGRNPQRSTPTSNCRGCGFNLP
jgi:hypothetical protein